MDGGRSPGGFAAGCQWSDLKKQAGDEVTARHAAQPPSTAFNPALSASLFLVHANPMRTTILPGMPFMRVGGTDDLFH
jgi:hypothetical protein